MLPLTTTNNGSVIMDEAGAVWWIPNDILKPRQQLADADSLCGWGFFETDPDDPLRDACSWHDKAYNEREFFELRGWNRYRIDCYFGALCMQIAGDDPFLICRANEYYMLVRLFGWILYYRHKGASVISQSEFDEECRAKLKSYIS